MALLLHAAGGDEIHPATGRTFTLAELQALMSSMNEFDDVCRLFVLDASGEPVPCSDREAWGQWIETATDRRLRSSHIPHYSQVITHFLGMDMRDTVEGPPELWETRVFGGPLEGEVTRYTSKADALAGHERMCARVSAAVRFRWSPSNE